MGDIIDQVLQAEEAANAKLDAARQKAAEMKKAVDADASSALEEAHIKAQGIVEERISRARAEADQDHERRIRETEKENSDFVERNSRLLEKIVDAVVELIVTPEYKK